MKVIAVHGKAQSGKGTFISSVFDTYKSYNPEAKLVEVNFADPLKSAVSSIFRIPLEDLYSNEGKEKFLPRFNTTVRDILQRFGTEGCRAIYEDIWVWNLMEEIRCSEGDGYDLVGVSDLRFKNEYAALKNIGAYTIKTIRPSFQIDQNSHQSEIDLDDIDDWNLIIATDEVEDVVMTATEFTETDLLNGESV